MTALPPEKAKDDRLARLSDALRANLARRKAQARARSSDADAVAETGQADTGSSAPESSQD
ncbi:MAG: hypothetical protein Kow00104_14010 [Rhodothalassiaceae bacterium]